MRRNPLPIFTWPLPKKYGPAKLADVFGSTSTATHGVFRAVRTGGHTGWDFRAPRGVKVRPVAGGVVYEVVASGDCGFGARVRHMGGFTSSYCHFDGPALVRVGDVVTRRTILGRVGDTGNAGYTHLHLSVEFWGRRVDPLLLFLPAAERFPVRIRARIAALEAAHLEALAGPVGR